MELLFMSVNFVPKNVNMNCVLEQMNAYTNMIIMLMLFQKWRLKPYADTTSIISPNYLRNHYTNVPYNFPVFFMISGTSPSWPFSGASKEHIASFTRLLY